MKSEWTAEVELPVNGEKKLAMLIIQCTGSAERLTSDSEYLPDDARWESLLPEDIPAWVTQDETLTNLAAGERICQRPEQGGRWYRALQVNQVTH